MSDMNETNKNKVVRYVVDNITDGIPACHEEIGAAINFHTWSEACDWLEGHRRRMSAMGCERFVRNEMQFEIRKKEYSSPQPDPDQWQEKSRELMAKAWKDYKATGGPTFGGLTH